jgi:hypothetical protein
VIPLTVDVSCATVASFSTVVPTLVAKPVMGLTKGDTVANTAATCGFRRVRTSEIQMLAWISSAKINRTLARSYRSSERAKTSMNKGNDALKIAKRGDESLNFIDCQRSDSTSD